MVRKRVRRELLALIHGVLDAPCYEEAEEALQQLRAHKEGARLAAQMGAQLDRLLVYQLEEQRGLLRVGPEWQWRDFRLIMSHGRNHGCDERLERAALVWGIYRNSMPAQMRCESKRHYRRSGRSPLEVTGVPPGELNYLDALGL